MRGRWATSAVVLATTSALAGGVARAQPAAATRADSASAVAVTHLSATSGAASLQITCRHRVTGRVGCPVTIELTATRTVTRGHRTMTHHHRTAPPVLTLVVVHHTVLPHRTTAFTLALSPRGRALLKRSPALVERLQVKVGADPVLTRRLSH